VARDFGCGNFTSWTTSFTAHKHFFLIFATQSLIFAAWTGPAKTACARYSEQSSVRAMYNPVAISTAVGIETGDENVYSG
jgi:hypothetical protein